MRIVVTGGRGFQSAIRVDEVLSAVHGRFGIEHLAQGGARGLDELAKNWAISQHIPCTTHEAEWRRRGNAAGPIRNRTMLRIEQPDLVIVFSGGTGTEDCASAAVEMGFNVVRTTGKRPEQILKEIESICETKH